MIQICRLPVVRGRGRALAEAVLGRSQAVTTARQSAQLDDGSNALAGGAQRRADVTDSNETRDSKRDLKEDG
jgi:hypothetical protein